jgi:hypothetical protein
MSTIIAVAGPKGVGKTSLCKYLQFKYEHMLCNVFSKSKSELISPESEIVQFMESGRTNVFAGNSPIWEECFLGSTVSSGIFSFASKVKRISVEVLDLDNDGVFGSESNKNLHTDYEWEKMPLWFRWINSNDRGIRIKSEKGISDISSESLGSIDSEQKLFDFCLAMSGSPIGLRTGKMTNREIMQIVGTDIFRNFFDHNIWSKATVNEIKKSNLSLCLIDDMRFDSEAQCVLNEGGYIIVLDRKYHKKDGHASEKGLSDKNILSGKNVFIVNDYEDIMDKNNKVMSVMYDIINTQVNKSVSISK